MDEGRFCISAQELYQRIGTAAAPLIIYVAPRPGVRRRRADARLGGATRPRRCRANGGAPSAPTYRSSPRTIIARSFSADTSRPELAPQAAGLLALSLGLSANFANDRHMLEHGLTMYDAFYALCRSCRDEKHNWKPAAMRA